VVRGALWEYVSVMESISQEEIYNLETASPQKTRPVSPLLTGSDRDDRVLDQYRERGSQG